MKGIKGKLIFKVRTGSHLYGLADKHSDTDYLSVFIPHTDDLLGLSPLEYVDNLTENDNWTSTNVEEDVDYKCFSLPRFLTLLLRNNPNIIEVLFANREHILVCEPEAQELIDDNKKVVSQLVRKTFTGYAYSQKKKLVVKKERFISLQKGLDYIEKKIFTGDAQKNKHTDNTITSAKDIISLIIKKKYYREIVEKEASKLNSLLRYYKGKKQNCESFHKGMDISVIYRKLKDEYENYGWRVRTESFNIVGYDTKFAYHLIRLLFEGWQLLSTGRISYPLTGQAKEQILKIRGGLVPFDELMEMYDMWHEKIVSVNTSLPEKPDWEWANAYLIRTLKQSIMNEK